MHNGELYAANLFNSTYQLDISKWVKLVAESYNLDYYYL